MIKLPSWEITLYVFGPITVKNSFSFKQRKDIAFDQKLYSDIEITKNSKYGILINLTAYSFDRELARKAAIYFCGQALDVLSVVLDLPLILTSDNTRSPIERHERRVITADEWEISFKNSRLWLLTEPTFLRVLGWYRKGLYTEDPFDRFLAFWNSIETLCSKYNPNKDTCNDRGSICHTWEVFKILWGECDNWPIITGQREWIDKNYETRKNIAHGIVPVDIHIVEEVIGKLETIQAVARELIVGWQNTQLKPNITDEIRMKLQ
jgi:hypothetical protein